VGRRVVVDVVVEEEEDVSELPPRVLDSCSAMCDIVDCNMLVLVVVEDDDMVAKKKKFFLRAQQEEIKI
jgi:hypothetical protein